MLTDFIQHYTEFVAEQISKLSHICFVAFIHVEVFDLAQVMIENMCICIFLFEIVQRSDESCLQSYKFEPSCNLSFTNLQIRNR